MKEEILMKKRQSNIKNKLSKEQQIKMVEFITKISILVMLQPTNKKVK